MRLHQPPGTDLARAIMAMCSAKGKVLDARAIAARRWGHGSIPSQILHETRFESGELKAAVPAGALLDEATWGDEMSTLARAAAELLEAARRETIVGRLQGIRRAPLNVRVATQTARASGYWVGEGKPKPSTTIAIEASSLLPLKVEAACVLTDQLVEHSAPDAVEFIRRQLIDTLVSNSRYQLHGSVQHRHAERRAGQHPSRPHADHPGGIARGFAARAVQRIRRRFDEGVFYRASANVRRVLLRHQPSCWSKRRRA